jgi:DNA-directed RNA polymerase subunit E'/Rpb7
MYSMSYFIEANYCGLYQTVCHQAFVWIPFWHSYGVLSHTKEFGLKVSISPILNAYVHIDLYRCIISIDSLHLIFFNL